MPLSSFELSETLLGFFVAALGDIPMASSNTLASVEYRNGLFIMKETPESFNSFSTAGGRANERASTGKAFKVDVLRIELAKGVTDAFGNPSRSTRIA